jgi:hypothetical protein
VPSQEPPQAEPSVVHAGRAPWGSPLTATQVPALPATSQAWHCPSHVWSQHTPSTQLPLAHWLAPPQATPSPSRGTQIPPEHQSPAAQSASRAQLPRQAVAPQAYGSQLCVCCAGQDPAPPQPAARTAMPPAQLASRQVTAADGYAQAAVITPSQAPPQTVPEPRQAVRAPWGSPTTGEQTPSLPATSQAWHWPAQAWSQQRPSTQNPDPHSFAAVQACPAPALGRHCPEGAQ